MQYFSGGHTLAPCALPAGQGTESAVSSAWAWGNSLLKTSDVPARVKGCAHTSTQPGGSSEHRLGELGLSDTAVLPLAQIKRGHRKNSAKPERETQVRARKEKGQEQESKSLQLLSKPSCTSFCHDLSKFLYSTNGDLKICLVFRHGKIYRITSTWKKQQELIWEFSH